jgi:predicted peptidase
MMRVDEGRSDAQLLRIPYHSTATDESREFLVYLPIGYDTEKDTRWPVILSLHGGGARGDGTEDLDHVMRNGPLFEAWIRHRDLPFIMIGPQLPVFGMENQLQLRAGDPKPVRLASGPAPRPLAVRPSQPMARAPDLTPSDFDVTEAWGDDGPPGGWQLCKDDLLAMLDTVLKSFRTDPDRVYLTGLSYGGYGAWDMATTYPDRWAAVAPICGGANLGLVRKLAEVQMPLWIFQGGRDARVKPQWIYDVANALERAGHQSVRLTIHEDMGHDCWTRVYGGLDLYDWFLSHRRR